MTLILIVNKHNRIIYKKAFNQPKNPLPYLLAYAVLDSSVSQYYEAYYAESIILNSGHRIVFVRKKTQKVPKKFINKMTQSFIKEIMSPFVNDDSDLGGRFNEEVTSLFNQYIFNISYSL